MATLYITSLEAGAGKTALAAALGKRLQGEGRKVGFLRLLPSPEDPAGGDASSIRQLLSLAETDSLSTLAEAQEVASAHAEVSRGKDVVLVEGLSGLEGGLSAQMAGVMGARAVVMARYREGFEGEGLEAAARAFSDRLLGVVLNFLPRQRWEVAKTSVGEAFREKGITVLGALPEDRLLFTVSVGDLAEHLGGEVLNSAERSGELVENLMVGAMSLDPGPLYFRQKTNKAVITGGDRPDVQLAALQTSTRCLILTGGISPLPVVRYEAEQRGVPLILVKGDTLAVVAAVEGLLGKGRFRQEKKVERMEKMLAEHIDLKALYQGLGLPA